MDCDRCGRKVGIGNSAKTFQYILEYGKSPESEGFTVVTGFGDRHLLPEDGCEGSPSRTKYMVEISDEEHGGEYDPVKAERYRLAFELLKTLR
ncbi:MAG: hypothetical protein V3U74_01030 [Thermodesulfobacteriota bacterium]